MALVILHQTTVVLPASISFKVNIYSFSLLPFALTGFRSCFDCSRSDRKEGGPKVDNLLIMIVEDSCKGGWANEQRNSFFPSGSTSTYMQICSFRALLISLLSRSRIRLPHLAQSLELFRRGRQETRTKLSKFCCHALLTLEVLIHPRALPLENFQSVNSYDEKDGC